MAESYSVPERDPEAIDVDIVTAVEMLIKSVIHMGQRLALIEIALAQLQNAGVDDGK